MAPLTWSYASGISAFIPSWSAGAACAVPPHDDETWVNRGGDEHPRAMLALLSVCVRCPVRSECLTDAMSTPYKSIGVWGGSTTRERARAARRNRTRNPEVGRQRAIAELIGNLPERLASWEALVADTKRERNRRARAERTGQVSAVDKQASVNIRKRRDTREVIELSEVFLRVPTEQLQDRLFTSTDLCSRWQVSRTTLYELVSTGRLDALRFGARSYRFTNEAVRAFENSHRTTPAEAV